MKLMKVASMGCLFIAGFVMTLTSAMASTHRASFKKVKCMVNTCKDGKPCQISVPKSICEQLGGVVLTAAHSKAPPVTAAAPNAPPVLEQPGIIQQGAEQAPPSALPQTVSTQAVVSQTASVNP